MFELCLLACFIACLCLALTAGLYSLSVTKIIGGLFNQSSSKSVSDALATQANVSVPAAQPGSLTTRSTNTTGTLTMTNAAHGLTTGQRVDLFWTGGQCYGAVLGTVSGLTVPIASVSGGSVLPAALTAINVGISTSVPFAFTGNNLSGVILVSTSTPAYFVFNNGAADVYAAYVSNGSFDWLTGDVASNPLAGATPTVLWVSHADTTAAHTDISASAVSH